MLPGKYFEAIAYEPGKERDITVDEPSFPFPFDLQLEETNTSNETAMTKVADLLDRLPQVRKKAPDYLKERLKKNDGADYPVLDFFISGQIEELDMDEMLKMGINGLSKEALNDHLKMTRIASYYYPGTDEQIIDLDLMFHAEDFTDEILVVRLSAQGEILGFVHER